MDDVAAIERCLERGSLTVALQILNLYIEENHVRRFSSENIVIALREDLEFLEVKEFHEKFNQIVGAKPQHLTRRKLAERANFLFEELMEFANASSLLFTRDGKFIVDEIGPDQDMALQADALIDLVYVAKGTAVMMGLPWSELWVDVQRANMAKVLGETPRSKANPGQFLMDVTKPEGWTPPNTTEILNRNGYVRGLFTHGRVVNDNYCVDDKIYTDADVGED